MNDEHTLHNDAQVRHAELHRQAAEWAKVVAVQTLETELIMLAIGKAAKPDTYAQGGNLTNIIAWARETAEVISKSQNAHYPSGHFTADLPRFEPADPELVSSLNGPEQQRDHLPVGDLNEALGDTDA